ncbi:MAG: PorT family protein [Paludibacteraceae bacterium]|nr:PorT family protein [Paludibacteraceae bacterium]
MKKLITAVLMILLTTYVYAQPICFAKVAAQYSNFSSDGSESMLGIRGAIGSYVPLGQSSFYFQPQLVYAQKGQDAGKFLDKCKIHYAEVPLNIGALIKFTRNIGLGLMVGPYVSVGVAGKSDNPEMTEDLFNKISRFDAGLNAGIQFHIWKIFVFADYDWGMRNLMHSPDLELGENLTTRAGAIGIGFAY